jgi:ribosome-binding protein aMBF1 (putative translation factor)
MMPAKKYRDLHERVTARPGARKRLARLREENLAEIGLYEIRRSRDLSQVELAERLQVTQSAVSKVEGAEDLRLSTLRDYVEALGGRLELRASFDDGAFIIEVGDRSRSE